MKMIEIAPFTPEGVPSRSYERVIQLGRDIMALAVRVPRPLLVHQAPPRQMGLVAAGEYLSDVVLKDQNVSLNVEVIDLNVDEDGEPDAQRKGPRYRLVMNAMAGTFWHTEDEPANPPLMEVNPNRMEYVEEFELSGGVLEQQLQKKYGNEGGQEDAEHPLHLYYMLGEELQDLERYTPEELEEVVSSLILSFYVRYGIDTLLKSQPREDQFEYIHGVEDWMIQDDDFEYGEENLDIDYEDDDAPNERDDPGAREPDWFPSAEAVESSRDD